MFDCQRVCIHYTSLNTNHTPTWLLQKSFKIPPFYPTIHPLYTHYIYTHYTPVRVVAEIPPHFWLPYHAISKASWRCPRHRSSDCPCIPWNWFAANRPDSCRFDVVPCRVPLLHPQILVGGAITILKNMKVNGKDDIPYVMENKKCSKPPTRISLTETAS